MENGMALIEACNRAKASLTAAVDRVVDQEEEPFVAIIVLDEIRDRLAAATNVLPRRAPPRGYVRSQRAALSGGRIDPTRW